MDDDYIPFDSGKAYEMEKIGRSGDLRNGLDIFLCLEEEFRRLETFAENM